NGLVIDAATRRYLFSKIIGDPLFGSTTTTHRTDVESIVGLQRDPKKVAAKRSGIGGQLTYGICHQRGGGIFVCSSRIFKYLAGLLQCMVGFGLHLIKP